MRRSIFYLDDEPDLLDLFATMFGNEYDVRTSTSLAEARNLLKGSPPDIIISDQKMPDIEGTAFLREAAQLCPNSYRVLLTGVASVIEVVTEVTTGTVQSFVKKPWTEEGIRAVLDRASVEINYSDRSLR